MIKTILVITGVMCQTLIVFAQPIEFLWSCSAKQPASITSTYDRNSNRLFVSHENFRISQWDASTGMIRNSLIDWPETMDNIGLTYLCAVDNTGEYLIASVWSKIQIWDIQRKVIKHVIDPEIHIGSSSMIATAKKGAGFVVVDGADKIVICNLESGIERTIRSNVQGYFRAVDYRRDEEEVFVITNLGEFKAWNVATGQLIDSLNLTDWGGVKSAQVLKNLVFYVDDNNLLWKLDVDTMAQDSIRYVEGCKFMPVDDSTCIFYEDRLTYCNLKGSSWTLHDPECYIKQIHRSSDSSIIVLDECGDIYSFNYKALTVANYKYIEDNEVVVSGKGNIVAVEYRGLGQERHVDIMQSGNGEVIARYQSNNEMRVALSYDERFYAICVDKELSVYSTADQSIVARQRLAVQPEAMAMSGYDSLLYYSDATDKIKSINVYSAEVGTSFYRMWMTTKHVAWLKCTENAIIWANYSGETEDAVEIIINGVRIPEVLSGNAVEIDGDSRYAYVMNQRDVIKYDLLTFMTVGAIGLQDVNLSGIGLSDETLYVVDRNSVVRLYNTSTLMFGREHDSGHRYIEDARIFNGILILMSKEERAAYVYEVTPDILDVDYRNLENESQRKIEVYPNPAVSGCLLNLNIDGFRGFPAKITIYNIYGKAVQGPCNATDGNASEGRISIQLGSLVRGQYIMKIEVPYSAIYRKLIVR